MPDARLVPIRNTLRKALLGSRKLSREVAVSRAQARVEGMRADLTAGLLAEVGRVEALGRVPGDHLSESAQRDGIAHARVIFNLAGTLGYPVLQTVAANLHDVLAAMLEKGLHCTDPVIVHALAATLAVPGALPLPPDEAEILLGHLHRIVEHFRDDPKPCRMDCAACPGVATRN